MPVVLGGNGVEKVIEVEFTAAEKAEFAKSVESVRGLIEKSKELMPK